MLNIISRAWNRPEAGAVHKVAQNLVAGLERLGYPFVLNRRIDYCSRIWIHDDYRAIMALPSQRNGLKVVLGPNLFVMPRDIPKLVRIPDYCVYLHPSPWAADAWVRLGYSRSKIDSWPVGIDTTGFSVFRSPNRSKILFYYKCRDRVGDDGAARIEAILKKQGREYVRIDYGNYCQEDYLRALGESSYVIWYGRQESQGLALQEALAMGCPVIVIDVNSIGDHDGTGYKFSLNESNIPATSAPYFDERCGLIIKSIDELSVAIECVENNLDRYSPKEYIKDHLSIEGCAQDMINKFDKWWPNETDIKIGEFGDEEFTPPFRWVAAAIELRWRTRGFRGLIPRGLLGG